MSVVQQRMSRRRLIVILFFFALGLAGIAWRLVFIQVVKAEKYKALALKQRKEEIVLPSYRGTIYDRRMQELAVSVEKESIYATPYLIKDQSQAASLISSALNISRSELHKKLSSNRGFVYIMRKADRERVDKIKGFDIEGIEFFKESKRYYPGNSEFSHVVGVVDVDNKGLTGIELYYDNTLKGKLGRIILEKDPLGHSIPHGIHKRKEPTHGSSLVLTIDRDIQYIAKLELKKAIKKWKAKSGTIIVLEPKSGEIYAMVNEPTFDPNNLSKVKPDFLRNRAITDQYEPGSTIKPLIVATALEEGLFNPDSVLYLPPKIKIGNKVIGEAHNRGEENFSLTDIITYSSNVGAARIGLSLGKERMYKYLKSFGLGTPTKVDFPGEVSGHIPPPSQWFGPTIGTIAFGQGLAITPLQLARAYSIIANGGFLITPHFVTKIVNPEEKKEKKISPSKGAKVLSSDTAWQTTLMLEKVVEEGTGKSAQIEGYSVAGKTGTAQKPRKKGRGFDPGKYVSSFVGFAPVGDPKLVVLVVIDEPQEGIYGSTVAAPVFKEVMEFSLQHLGVLPH